MGTMRPGPALFVQPHYDDVALSCGGTAAAFAALGFAPRIATVFASEILEPMVGPFAQWKHERWGLEDHDEVAAARREEDACAAAALGCGVRWLGLPDAIYRGERYTSDTQLYGGLHRDEYALAAHLAEELQHLPEWRPDAVVCVPLAIGQHVDHQLVFEAGRVLARRGVEVWAYEDLPYAIHTPAGVEQRLARVGDAVGPQFTVPIDGALEHKLAAVACYHSQLPVIFRFRPDFRAALREHALAVGGGHPAERYWQVLG